MLVQIGKYKVRTTLKQNVRTPFEEPPFEQPLKKNYSFEPQWDEFRMHAFGIVLFKWPKIHLNADQTKTPIRTRMGGMFLE
jgi:hypothetical protein